MVLCTQINGIILHLPIFNLLIYVYIVLIVPTTQPLSIASRADWK